MNIPTILIYIISSIILNIILNKLEQKKQDNFLDYIIIANIYIFTLSGIFAFYNLTPNNDNIFIIIFFLVLGKILYLTLIKERTILRNHDYHLKKYLSTLISSYLLNILIINQVDNVFPNMETIKLIIWIFIIGYLLLYMKKNINIKIPINNNISFFQDKEYIVMQYAKYKNKYQHLITSKYPNIVLLMYSLLIYENYHKPEPIRQIDRLKYKLLHQEGKFGIMQIEKKYPITDEESIKIAQKTLEKLYQINCKETTNDKATLKILIKKYYKEEKKEVETIYQTIKNFNQK